MRYNKSEIMKKAWELFKADAGIKVSFSECLKIAWKKAKKSVSNKIETVKRNINFSHIESWFLRKMDSVSFMALESGMAVNDIILEKETEKAIMISTEWNGYRKKMWFPKSVVLFFTV